MESEAHLNFSVIFDGEHSLKTGLHNIVTPVQLLYYKEYSEDHDGHVISKEAAFSSPLQTVAIKVEIPGKILIAVSPKCYAKVSSLEFNDWLEFMKSKAARAFPLEIERVPENNSLPRPVFLTQKHLLVTVFPDSCYA